MIFRQENTVLRNLVLPQKDHTKVLPAIYVAPRSAAWNNTPSYLECCTFFFWQLPPWVRQGSSLGGLTPIGEKGQGQAYSSSRSRRPPTVSLFFVMFCRFVGRPVILIYVVSAWFGCVGDRFVRGGC